LAVLSNPLVLLSTVDCTSVAIEEVSLVCELLAHELGSPWP